MAQAGEIHKLREETGAGIMDCKRALEEAKDDVAKAREILKAQGLARADKKRDRVMKSGIVTSYIHNDRVGVLLALHCETDFVTKTEGFRDLAHNIAMQIAAMAPENKEELLKQPYIKDSKLTVEDLVKSTVGTIGENMEIGEFARFTI